MALWTDDQGKVLCVDGVAVSLALAWSKMSGALAKAAATTGPEAGRWRSVG